MKVEELVLAKCIDNRDEEDALEIRKFYVVEEIYIGQSNSSVKINGKIYNSIKFEYYDDNGVSFDIYHSKYSPYFPYHKEEDKKIKKIKITYDEGDVALDDIYLTCNHSEVLANKLNEVIDVLNELIKK